MRGGDAAFAAVLEEGTVVAWGASCGGSVPEEVQEQLTGVQERRLADGWGVGGAKCFEQNSWGVYFGINAQNLSEQLVLP